MDILVNGIKINFAGYAEILNNICNAAEGSGKKIFGYANVNSFNLCYKYPELKNYLNSFDIIHPDGTGIRMGVKFLNKNIKLPERLSGSDFYPLLINKAIKNKYSFYFFGHDNKTLGKIPVLNPELIIKGYSEGYNFKDEDIISDINSANPDILIIGLGTPKQEEWVYKYSSQLNCRVILIVGDGIKVFAGNKKRGPVFMQKAGLEWLYRFITNPVKYFGRYIIGNPLFLYRIFMLKMRKLPG